MANLRYWFEHPLDRFQKTGGIHPTAIFRSSTSNAYRGCDVKIGMHSIFLGHLEFHRAAKFSMGERSYVGPGTKLHIADAIVIGNDVMISWDCSLIDTDMHSIEFEERKHDVLITGGFSVGDSKAKDWGVVRTRPIVIQDKVWIGLRAIILKGVTLGEGCVVGAGSVVTEDVPPFCVAVGNPATVVKHI